MSADGAARPLHLLLKDRREPHAAALLVGAEVSELALGRRVGVPGMLILVRGQAAEVHERADVLLHIKRGELQRAARRRDRDVDGYEARLRPIVEALLVIVFADAVVSAPGRAADLVEDGRVRDRAAADVARQVGEPVTNLGRRIALRLILSRAQA